MKTCEPTLETRRQNGFTLIELLIVVVIIGILAAIAIPMFADTKGRAHIAAMKTDLRNLVTREEQYYIDNMAYTTDKSAAAMDYNESAGVTVTIVVSPGPPMSYHGIATHTGVAQTCAIYVNETAQAPAAFEGRPACT